MDDTSFITKLYEDKILPLNINSQLNVLPTQADKAAYFLDQMIKPTLDTDDSSSINKLLSIMKHCGYDVVEKLACEIKSELDEASDVEPGIVH